MLDVVVLSALVAALINVPTIACGLVLAKVLKRRWP